jgi:hypothetical protein
MGPILAPVLGTNPDFWRFGDFLAVSGVLASPRASRGPPGVHQGTLQGGCFDVSQGPPGGVSEPFSRRFGPSRWDFLAPNQQNTAETSSDRGPLRLRVGGSDTPNPGHPGHPRAEVPPAAENPTLDQFLCGPPRERRYGVFALPDVLNGGRNSSGNREPFAAEIIEESSRD